MLAAAFQAHAQDAAAVLRRAAAAMGTDELKTVRYTGAGTGASYGQAFRPDTDWPQYKLSSYTREVDYQAAAMREDAIRPREGRAISAASGRFAWNVQGPVAIPRQAALAQRLHDLWTTPHGVIKAAQRSRATVRWLENLAAVSFTEKGVFSAVAFINDQYLVERIESRMPDPVMGETPVVTAYWDYRELGSIKFPMRMRQSVAGTTVLDIEVKEVEPNAAVSIPVPAIVRSAKETVSAEKAAEGVWYLAGGSHHSVAIEMADYVVLVEAPLSEARTLAVMEEVRKLAPEKPIRYVVNSHHHFDHSAGLRAALGEGATLIAHAQAKPWYESLFARSGKKLAMVPVGEKLILHDGARKVEVHRLRPNQHAETLLMVYLPAERLLIQADAFTPGPPKAPPPAPPDNANALALLEAIERLKLAVERHLPLHGRIVSHAELRRAAGK